MKCKYKYTVEPLEYQMYGYTYKVSVWTSVDGGPFYYCGNGRYFYTEQEALAYKAEREQEHN